MKLRCKLGFHKYKEFTTHEPDWKAIKQCSRCYNLQERFWESSDETWYWRDVRLQKRLEILSTLTYHPVGVSLPSFAAATEHIPKEPYFDFQR